MYWWEDKVERASETLLMIKTRSELFDRVEREISQLHPYEVPEIIAVQIVQGAKKYLTWLKQVTKARG
jgi:periplasmic divalent cation tolerance protein